MDDHYGRVLNAVRFLEGHLKADVGLQDAAAAACLSAFHFDRVFRALTGETPLSYLRKRRLSAAFDELLGSDRKIVDIASDYRYDSAAAFSRAFSAQFGQAPQRLRSRRGRSILGYVPPLTDELLAHRAGGGVTFEPRIEARGPITLLGFSCTNTAARNAIPELWGRFLDASSRFPILLDRGTYGVYIYDFSLERYAATEDSPFDYMAAGEAPRDADFRLADGLSVHHLPARTYAVFRHRGLLADLGRAYKYAFGTWFPKRGLESLAAEHFEYRDRDYPGDFADSVTEIWIPLATTD